jgi:NAD(P)-dependent dehydrogenase (short-subunit alcohol dehydrogenase family)
MSRLISIHLVVQFPGSLYYNVSKAGLDQLTRCSALELAPKGVRVNAVNPGVIITECQKRAGMTDEFYEKFMEHSKTTHPLGRAGTAEEVAKAIAFLASDDASFITGVTLAVDGGRSVACPR